MKFMLNSLMNTLPRCRHIYKTTRVLSFYRDKEDISYNKPNRSKTVRNIIGATAVGFLGYQLYDKRRSFVYAKYDKITSENVGKFKEGLPSYSLEEVSKHNSRDTKIWVTYKEGVYDITDFVDSHPGGNQILIAAGSALEPFWVLYAIHENTDVYEILESLRIGNLHKEDVGDLSADMSDPYSADPVRHAVLIPASKKPFNAEVPPSLLVQSFITPKYKCNVSSNDVVTFIYFSEFFYIRNHLPVPEIDPDTYELEVELEGKNKTVIFTLEELMKLSKHTITATIMCAGNRRSEMAKVKPIKGLNWGVAAIGNATWTGVRLRDLLRIAGLNEDDHCYNHVQFESIDTDVTGKTYGASIPIWKALDKRGDVLIAYEMNGVPIPRDHGFPVRVVVPGVAGARHVKWLSRIVASKEESGSHWQQCDYKGFSPSTTWDTVDFSKSPAVQELPVTSAICQPSDGDTVKVKDGHILVKGYAWSGGGQKIVRVDVTADGGKTWLVADIDHQDTALPPQHWAWTLWSIKIPVLKDSKTVEIWVKATDSCYNTQPESFENIYNFRGVLSNAYHRINVCLKH